MYREQERKGVFDHLAGKCKPLNVPSGDLMNLQHEIRDQIQRLLENDSAEVSESVIGEINEKINKYNSMVRSPILQKWKVSRAIRQQIERWKS